MWSSLWIPKCFRLYQPYPTISPKLRFVPYVIVCVFINLPWNSEQHQPADHIPCAPTGCDAGNPTVTAAARDLEGRRWGSPEPTGDSPSHVPAGEEGEGQLCVYSPALQQGVHLLFLPEQRNIRKTLHVMSFTNMRDNISINIQNFVVGNMTAPFNPHELCFFISTENLSCHLFYFYYYAFCCETSVNE